MSDEQACRPVYANIERQRSSLDGAWTSEESLQRPTSLPAFGEPGGLQQDAVRELAARCVALRASTVNGQVDDPNSAVARRRRDQKKFRLREKARGCCNSLCATDQLKAESASHVLVQERSEAARSLLADTQKRLQQTEEQRSTLQARNQVLESYVFAQSTATSPPLSLAAAAQQVPNHDSLAVAMLNLQA